GLREPAFALQVAVAHPPRVAHPVLVHGVVLAWLEAEDRSLAMVDLDVAAVGARPAHGRAALEVPDAGAKPKITIGQRADGADVDDVRRVRVVERLPRREVELDVVAALRRPGLLARGVHHHAVRRARVARDLELRHLLDLDQAHAAVAGDGEAGVPAVVRDLDAEALGGANDGGAVLDRDPPAVDLN